jgi:hypothetical protein
MYDRVEQLNASELAVLVERVRGYPEVPTAPYSDTDITRRSIEALLRQRS